MIIVIYHLGEYFMERNMNMVDSICDARSSMSGVGTHRELFITRIVMSIATYNNNH